MGRRKNPKTYLRELKARGLPLRLVTARDIARHYGLSIDTVRQWRKRYSDFPKPVAIVNQAQQVYYAEEVHTWVAKMAVKARHRKRFAVPSAVERGERVS